MRQTLFIALGIILLIAACSEDESNAPPANPLVGEWNLVHYWDKDSGRYYPPDQLESALTVIKIYTDNRGTAYEYDYGELEEIWNFTWDIAGGDLILTLEDDDIVSLRYTVSGDRLTIYESDDDEWIYQRK